MLPAMAIPNRRVSKPLAEVVIQRLDRLELLLSHLLQSQTPEQIGFPEVSCVDPTLTAESLPTDLGRLTPDLRHDERMAMPTKQKKRSSQVDQNQGPQNRLKN